MRASPARPAPKVFGMQLGASPGKLVVLGVLAIVAIVFLIHNGTSSDGPGSTTTASTSPGASAGLAADPTLTPEPLPQRTALRNGRRKNNPGENSSLRFRPIDARKGNIDPTLRLDLLARLQSLPFAPSGRSLFEPGAAPVAAAAAMSKQVVTIDPGPKPPPSTANTPPPVPPMPLKFYGFVQQRGVAGPNRGFFMDGDNILVAGEGELLVKRYKVLQLTAKSAVMEDTVSNRRETLTLVPEASNAM